jgi:hypothetical protein
MLGEPSELSPDLEWMLQSGRASEAVLVEALTREQYAGLVRLAEGIAGEPARAEAIAARALADAVLSAHRYPVGLGVQDWLLSLIREREGKRQALGSAQLPDPPVADYPEEAIERAATEIHRLIAAERRRRKFFAAQEILVAGLAILGILLTGRWMSGLSLEATPLPTGVHTALVTRLVYISPTPAPRATPTPFPERAILYIAERGDTLASIAEKTGQEAILLQALNGLDQDAPLQAGQAVMLGLGGNPVADITPTPVTPAMLPVPLSTLSEPLQVFQRIFESERYYHTLWVQAQVIEYGPPGLIGPPEVKQLQAWISRPSLSLTLLGDPDGTLERVTWSNAGNTYSIDLSTGRRILYISHGLDLMQLDELIQQSVTNIEIGAQQEIVRLDTQSGRVSLVMDWFQPEIDPQGEERMVRQGRYWIDNLTGVILRRQRFARLTGGGEFLLSETIIDRIAYDVDLSNTLFDPYGPLPSRFARDFAGDPFPAVPAHLTPTRTSLPGQ